MKMKTYEFKVSFTTPAFLGGADQSGQWRTPPFKHLLREWWRVAWCEDKRWSDDVDKLRKAEGELFGSAADKTGHRSKVRLRLERWEKGQLYRWKKLGNVAHPDVGRPIESSLYLGYGPLIYDNKSKSTSLKPNAAIQEGESSELRLAFPDTYAPILERILGLAHAFGTLGGRSRNGWGSVAFEGAPQLEGLPLRDWRKCLDRDWAHAIGKDETGPLIWQTVAEHDKWQTIMRDLAIIKIGLRTQFKFHSGDNAPRPELRHWLSHPITHHNVKHWKKGRLPNSLRFKVRRLENGKLVGVIYHMPHLPPGQFRPERQVIECVWRCVHVFLDALTRPADQRRYCDQADHQALAKQKEQLDRVMLKRVSE